MAEKNENPLQSELALYPFGHECIGKLIIQPPNVSCKKYTSNLATIVILDRSSSMCDSVERFVNIILPQVFDNLQYSADEIIHLITFDDRAERFDITVGSLYDLRIYSQGCTFMKYPVESLCDLIQCELSSTNKSIRLLTISDGEVYDQDETQIAANNLLQLIDKNIQINSQAVRLFTSECQPDTRAVSSLLQLNNVTKVNLLDLATNLTNIEMATAISNLFIDDHLRYQISLSSTENIFKISPWLPYFTNKLTLTPGDNIFWLKSIPSEPVYMDNTIVTVSLQSELNLDMYEKLLRKKIEQYISQLKILKIVDTDESIKVIRNIVTYFQKCETNIINKEQDVQLLLTNFSLTSRMHYLMVMIKRKAKTFSMRMAQIENDQKISLLNSAQQADYLRTVDNSRNSRGLARRALTQGIDFNEVLRKEVRRMSEHLDEIKDIDDRNHTISFYSRGTTLDGIKTLCNMVNENILDDMDANDILLLINIVGVACSGPIGDFPDPMTWRVDELYLGCNVSLSDVLTASVQSNRSSELKTPGTNKKISNVIPFFEDNRIFNFLRKYSPSLLEYICSIGMRRVIAEVPMTFGYTICAGIWKMIEELNKKKSELHLKTFETMILNYEFFIGNYFSHIMPYIKDQGQTLNSYYIANNGITNMISPLISIYRSNDNKKEYIPNILRALYTYEIWQAIRRMYRKDNSDQIIKDMLVKLLGIDIEKHKTLVKPLYELEPDLNNIQFYDEPIVNECYLSTLEKTFYYVGYVTLIPKYIEAVLSKNTQSIVNISPLSEDSVLQALDINYNLRKFHLYNIVQALLFTTKSSRVDPDNFMKIVDLKNENEGEKMVRNYIRIQYHNQYVSDLTVKKHTEKIELSNYLVSSILESDKHERIVELMKNGVTRGSVSHKISNSASLGFVELKKGILNMDKNIPLRSNIMRIYLLGKDFLNNNDIVWNNGGVIFVENLTEFGNLFKTCSESEEWEKVYAEYKERRMHIYREKMNRHGHGNEKPSYWAFGYLGLQNYKNDVSDEEFKKYCADHPQCCGVPQILGLIT